MTSSSRSAGCVRDVLSSPLMITTERILSNIAASSLMSGVRPHWRDYTDKKVRPITGRPSDECPHSYRIALPLRLNRPIPWIISPTSSSTRWALTASMPAPRSMRVVERLAALITRNARASPK